MRTSAAARDLCRKLIASFFAATLALGLVPAAAFAAPEDSAIAANETTEEGSSDNVIPSEATEGSVVEESDPATPSVGAEHGLRDGEEPSGDNVQASEDNTLAMSIPAATERINEDMVLTTRTIAQAESTRSYFLAQTLESTRTVPIVSANLPLDIATLDDVVEGGSDPSEDEGGENSDEPDPAIGTIASESTVIGSFTYRGITYAIEPSGESVALVAADYSKLPEEFIDAQTIVLPSIVTSDGLDFYSVTRIADHAFSSMAPQKNEEPITAVTIPASVTEIGDDAFTGFGTLEYIMVSEDNPVYGMYDGCLYNADLTSLLLIPGGRLGAVRISSGVEEISPEAFSHCASVDTLVADADSAAFQLLTEDGFLDDVGVAILTSDMAGIEILLAEYVTAEILPADNDDQSIFVSSHESLVSSDDLVSSVQPYSVVEFLSRSKDFDKPFYRVTSVGQLTVPDQAQALELGDISSEPTERAQRQIFGKTLSFSIVSSNIDGGLVSEYSFKSWSPNQAKYDTRDLLSSAGSLSYQYASTSVRVWIGTQNGEITEPSMVFRMYSDSAPEHIGLRAVILAQKKDGYKFVGWSYNGSKSYLETASAVADGFSLFSDSWYSLSEPDGLTIYANYRAQNKVGFACIGNGTAELIESNNTSLFPLGNYGSEYIHVTEYPKWSYKATVNRCYTLATFDNKDTLVRQLSFRVDPADGWYFVGWSKSSSGSPAVSSLTEDDVAPSVCVIYAVFQPRQYTVSFDDQGATDVGTTSVSATFTKDMPSITPPKKAGYEFLGYFAQPQGLGLKYYEPDGTSAHAWDIENSAVLHAYWTKKVELDSQEADTGEEGSSEVTVTWNAAMPTTDVVAPKKNGYTFGGYWTKEGGNGKQYYTASMASANTWNEAGAVSVLYAKWSKTITLANSGTGGTSKVTVTWNAAMPTTDVVAPQKDGYDFVGYWTQKYGKGKQYYTDAMVSANEWTEDGSVAKLYAWWSAHTYKVQYKTRDGKNIGEPVSGFVYGTNKALADKPAEQYLTPGYTAQGWATSENQSVSTYNFGANVSKLTAEDGATVDLYVAERLNDARAFLVKLHPDSGPGAFVTYKDIVCDSDGSGESRARSAKVTIGEDTGYVLDTYTSADASSGLWGHYKGTPQPAQGYYFKRYIVVVGDWNAPSTVTAVEAGTAKELIATDQDMYVQAVFGPITYKVAYEGNGATSGSMDTSGHVYDEWKQLTANAFEKTGFDFMGWNTEPDGSGECFEDEDQVKNLTDEKDAIVTLYAQWAPHTYTVRFVPNRADLTQQVAEAETITVEAEREGSIQIPYPATRGSGLVFSGWASAPDESATPYAPSTSVAVSDLIDAAGTPEDNLIVLYGRWNPVISVTAPLYATVVIDPESGDMIASENSPLTSHYDNTASTPALEIVSVRFDKLKRGQESIFDVPLVETGVFDAGKVYLTVYAGLADAPDLHHDAQKIEPSLKIDLGKSLTVSKTSTDPNALTLQGAKGLDKRFASDEDALSIYYGLEFAEGVDPRSFVDALPENDAAGKNGWSSQSYPIARLYYTVGLAPTGEEE